MEFDSEPAPASLFESTVKRKKDALDYKHLEIWLRENTCAGCGGVPTERDHICRGNSRDVSLLNTETILPLCQGCHRFFGDAPIEDKLILKFQHIRSAVEKYTRRNVDWEKVKGLL